MKRSTPPRIPRSGDAKRYSLNQVIGALAVGIFVTFILGTIFGLRIGSRPDREAVSTEVNETPDTSAHPQGPVLPSFEERTRSTPEKEAAWDRAMAARRAELGNDRGSYGTSSATGNYTGKHPIDAYRPEAEDVVRHWSNETGQPMSQSDVKTIQWLMKTIDDKE